jgi:uncharacterized protein YecT (DUF1311 family)
MIKYFKNLSLIVLLASAANGHAQTLREERQEDRIDVEYNECLNKDSSSVNICNCAFVAYDKWNKELDNAYKKVLKTLKKEKDRDALKQSQTAWVVFKDAEFKAYDFMFNIPGTNWCSLRQDGRIDIVRARTLQLRSYAESFKN